MTIKFLSVLAAALLAVGCGNSSSSPSTPTATTAQPTIAAAAIVLSGSSNWGGCLPAFSSFVGSCILNAAIQNTGSGCAGGLTAVVQLRDASGQQLGADRLVIFLMPIGHVVRPSESIQFQTLSVDLPTVNATKGLGLKPTWTNVSCS